MAKLNYQRISRETMLKNKPLVGEKHSPLRFADNKSPVSLNGPDYVLKFGKHKGSKLRDLPDEYITWAILNISDSRVDMFIRELQRRDPSFNI